MVSPSCSMEYQPTVTFWGILFFVVFPSIYLSGKVVGAVISVLLRVLRGLCRILLWDDDDYEEERVLRKHQRKAISMNKKHLFHKLQEEMEEEKNRAIEVVKKCTDTNDKITSLLTKKNSCAGTTDGLPTSDISESLNSECNTTEEGVPISFIDSNDKENAVISNGTCVQHCDQVVTC